MKNTRRNMVMILDGKKIFCCLLLCLFTSLTYAQRLFYDIKKDKPWIDSVKKIAGKEPYDNGQRNYYLQQLKYIKSCIALGQYYEKCFQKKILPSNKLAVKYFEKVTDIGTFPGDEKYYKAAALRNNVSRKLAAIYFDGVGIKKDKKRSLQLVLQGSSGYDGFFEYYSQKYFNCKCIVLSLDSASDSLYSIKINPFANQTGGNFHLIIYDNILKKIAESFKKKFVIDTALNMNITAYPVASMRSQARAMKALDILKSFFIERYRINVQKIIMNAEIGGGDNNVIDILFTKRIFN